MADGVFVGIDLGASRTKVAVVDSGGKLIGHAVRKSGIDFAATAADCLSASLKLAEVEEKDIAGAVSTGYGRANVSFLTENTKSEIGCLGKGCHRLFPQPMTIIDIGGQDNKIIKVDGHGRRTSFKMNRKCAAGTGAFLEEMANRLDVALEDLDGLARQSTEMIKLGSYCTVFSGTEVLENIRLGKKLSDIVKGLFHSVIKRVLEMDSLTERVVMTGGVVAHNPFIIEMTEQRIGRPIQRLHFPQLIGAYGAALYALQGSGEDAELAGNRDASPNQDCDSLQVL